METLRSNDVRPGHGLGQAVAVLGDLIAVSAHSAISNDGVDDAGAVYLFERSRLGGGWVQTAKITAPDAAPADSFGSSIAIDGSTLLVGAPRDDDNGEQSGSAYVFDLTCIPRCAREPAWQCDGDGDGDGQVNPVDASLVQAAFCTGGRCIADDLCQYDLDCDGRINPVDSGIVQSLFGTCEGPRDVCP